MTYSNVIATFALFLALGGGAYAAFKLPAKSVGSRELKSRAVTPRKVAPATVALFKGQKGAKGDPGAQGAQGAQGSQGIAGADGPRGPSNAYFNHAYGDTASVSVPAGDYAVHGQALFGNTSGGGQGACFLYANGGALNATAANSGIVTQIPAGGFGQAFDQGVAHLATAGTISNQCSPSGGVGTATTNNALTAVQVASASP
ncbi:MAG: hypothetical protein ACJ76Z_10585 [Thermoleophilaceae bacterium]